MVLGFQLESSTHALSSTWGIHTLVRTYPSQVPGLMALPPGNLLHSLSPPGSTCLSGSCLFTSVSTSLPCYMRIDTVSVLLYNTNIIEGVNE